MTNNIREALETSGLKEELIRVAVQNAEDIREAGYNEETVEALRESYTVNGPVIEGEFTIEKLMMATDPEQAFADFWEGANA
jgi:hypothetical protein